MLPGRVSGQVAGFTAQETTASQPIGNAKAWSLASFDSAAAPEWAGPFGSLPPPEVCYRPKVHNLCTLAAQTFADLSRWFADGRLVYREDIKDGL